MTSVTSSQYLGFSGLNQVQVVVTGAPIPTISGTLSFLDISNANYSLTSVALGTQLTGFSALASVGGTPIAQPRYTVVGDFNGDGKLDFVTASSYANIAQTFLGNGDGTFTLTSTFSVRSPAGLLTGDCNGDGKLDLAILNSGTISIYLGNGDGTFTLSFSPSTGNYPYSFTSSDFNSDGIPDFAVTNYYTNTVKILLGNGDGSFRSGNSYSTGVYPEGITAADFNRDGNTDLAIANESDKTVAILLGNGDGTFLAGPNIILPATPYTLVAADFNRDGIPDLAVTAIIQGAEIYLGNGDGTFNIETTLTCGVSGNGYGIAIADFNRDGNTDLVIGGALFTGDGAGNFTLMGYVGGNGSPVSVGDFNGDGSSDLITPVYSDSYPFYGNVNISLVQSSVSMMINPVRVPGPGTHQVVASYGGDGGHAGSRSNPVALTGAQIATTLSLGISPANVTPSGATVQFTASLSPISVGNYIPGGSVAFNDGATVLGTAPVSSGQAILTTNTLSIGSHTITASYSGDSNFVRSNSNSVVLSVTTESKVTPVITWPTPAPISYGTPLSGTQLNATTGGVPGIFVYTPAEGAVLSAGSHILSVTFTPSDTTSYNSATATVTQTINPSSQTITVTTPAPITAAYNSQFTVAATATSGLTISYSASGGCVNSGANFSMTSATLACTVTYSQPGDGNHLAAPNVTNTTTATKGNQATLTVTGMPGAAQEYGATFTVGSSGGSGTGAITFAATGACAANSTSGLVTITSGTGTCSVTVTKAADMNYNSATSATATVSVVKASTTIIVNGPKPTKAGTPFVVNVSVVSQATGTPTGSVTISADQGSCTVTLNNGVGSCSMTIASKGIYTLTATYGGDANFANSSGSFPNVHIN